MIKRTHTILGALTLLFALIPFFVHIKTNDNRLNYTNHEYAKNLLNTLEPYSIFMTEGGDNQVFATAYSQMAQQLRPDVRVYDQKGNVFYRIYGDFRYISLSELEVKRDIVDFEIFSRGRPVYLTWRRSPDVAVCGDWFLKRYGMLYKVVPLRYRILEDLGADIEITLDEAHRLIEKYYADRDVLDKMRKNLLAMDWYIPAVFETQQRRYSVHFINDDERLRLQRSILAYHNWLQGALARNVTRQFSLGLLRELQAEGYLRIEGNRVVFVRDIQSPFEGDYWERYAFSHRDVPKAVNWDYLTREVLTNYNFYYAEYCREMIERLTRQKAYYERRIRELGRRGDLVAALDAIEEKLERYRQLEEESYRNAAYYGYDMAVIFHNLGVINVQRGQLDEAVEAFRRGVLADRYSYQTIYSYILLRLRQSDEGQDPDFERLVINEATQIVYGVLQRLRKTYAANEIGFQEDRNVQLFVRLEQGLLTARRKFPLHRVLEYKALYEKEPDNREYQTEYASALYSHRMDTDGVVQLFESAPDSKWNNEMFVYYYGRSLQENGETDAAIAALERLRREKPFFFPGIVHLGQMYDRLKGEPARAQALFEEVLRIPEATVLRLYPDLELLYRDRVRQLQRMVNQAR
jgi:tetratricopeptide (TPR) repeat protein